MPKLTDEQRRALRLLARSPNGCTEAIMLAHGFESALLGKLTVDGLAKVEVHDTSRRPKSESEGHLAAPHRGRPEDDRGMKKPRRTGRGQVWGSAPVRRGTECARDSQLFGCGAATLREIDDTRRTGSPAGAGPVRSCQRK
jgi:hypothetical protein